jgi:hypothetical protein
MPSMDWPAREVPWLPGLLTYDPLGRAARAWWHEGIQDRDLVYAVLVDQFPDANAAQLGKVASQMARLAPLIDGFFDRADDSKLERTSIPRNAALPEAYQYHVDKHFTNTVDDDETTRTVIIDSSRNLAAGELHAMAELLSQRYFFDSPGTDKNRLDDPENWVQTGAQLLLAQRRT